jgi:NADH dehydrogenase
VILLVGGTGLLGGRIAEKLHERGIPYRALVRDGTDASSLNGAEIVRGDLQRPETLPAALAGVTTVVTTATSIGRRLAGDKRASVEGVDLRGNEALIDAAERAGVERFVFVSVPMDSEMLVAPLPRAKQRIEQRLERSPMREVILRPEMFQEIWLSEIVQLDWRKGKATIFGRGETPHAYVAVDDVAETSVRTALAGDPPHLVEFGGPDCLTRNDVVRRFERATGRPIKVRRIPRFVLRAGCAALGRISPVQASVMGMAWAADVQKQPATPDALLALGIEPRPTGAYIDEVAGGG